MEKHNILFLDFDGVLNSSRSFYKKFAEHHGVKWVEEDFDPKYWWKENKENINPDFYQRVEDAWKNLRNSLTINLQIYLVKIILMMNMLLKI